MKWLQSKKYFQDLAKYNERNGEYKIIQRKNTNQPVILDGSFDILANNFWPYFLKRRMIHQVIQPSQRKE